MCGICGLTGTRDKSIIEQMANLIAHRGPDQHSYYFDENIHLGHRRLSIIDLSENGRQPMTNEDGSIWLVFNGEIYNFQEIRKELLSKGHVFTSRTDSEVIIHAYESWGDDFVKKFQGMFAFALWDQKKKRLVLARDRIGIKPLYYMSYNGIFSFASEAKAFMPLKKIGWVPQINTESLRDYLSFSFIPDEKTMLKAVHKVQPGSLLIKEGDKITVQRYWCLEDEIKDEAPKSFDIALEELEELLFETVKMHLISDVPVGILLSGGLDSSILTYFAKKAAGSNMVNTFTLKFNHKLDESKYARQLADSLGTNHHELVMDRTRIKECLNDAIGCLDDLTSSDGGILSTYMISKMLAEHGIKVVLVGEGADEIFGGYQRFKISQYPYMLLPRKVRDWTYYYTLNRGIFLDKPGTYFGIYNKYKLPHLDDTFRDISFWELTRQIPNHLLMKVDKSTMANSVEARVPYLDHKLVEYVFNLRSEWKLKGSFADKNIRDKYILRSIAGRYIFKGNHSRKKQGFLMPPMPELLSVYKEQVNDMTRSQWEDVPKKALRRMVERNSAGEQLRPREYHLLWRMLMFHLWSKKYGLSG